MSKYYAVRELAVNGICVEEYGKLFELVVEVPPGTSEEEAFGMIEKYIRKEYKEFFDSEEDDMSFWIESFFIPLLTK